MFRRGRIGHADRRIRSCLSGRSGMFLMTMFVIMLLVVMLIMTMLIVTMVIVVMIPVVVILVVMSLRGMVLVTVEIVMRMHGFAAIERIFDQLRSGRKQSCVFVGPGHLMFGPVVAD